MDLGDAGFPLQGRFPPLLYPQQCNDVSYETQGFLFTLRALIREIQYEAD